MGSKLPPLAGPKRRPVLNIPPTPLERFLDLIALLGLAALIGVTLWGFLVAPASVPTHFDALGKPDSYGGKASLLFLPIVGILLYGLFTVLMRYPHVYNYPRVITPENAARQYQLARTLLCWLKLFFCWLFAFIEWGIVQTALSHSTQGLFIAILIGMVVILAVSIVSYLRISSREK